MRTDEGLQKAVADALQREPGVRAGEVGVAAAGGAVRLSGVVHTCAEKYAAERAALRVPGVLAVSQEIRVESAGPDQGDWAIAEAVSRALQSETDAPVAVQAAVESGWVTLQGEVMSEARRDAAVEAVRHRSGVERIYNLVTVKPAVQVVAVEKEMEETPHPNGDMFAGCAAV